MATEYKDNLLSAYQGETHKLSHRVPCADLPKAKAEKFKFFRVKTTVRVPNTKRRKVVQLRVKKLLKYVKRAWAGYKQGKRSTK